MGTSAPDLLPLFRSQLQARLLSEVYLSTSHEFTISALAKRLAASISTVQREADRLIKAGLLGERRIGRARLVHANTDTAAYRPLSQLLAVSFGPPAIIAREFARIPGIRKLVIFGSWAARFHGEPGPQPNDIDLLVIGSPARGSVYDAAEAAEEQIGLSVNAALRTEATWEAGEEGLIRQIKASPLVEVDHNVEDNVED